MNGIHPDQANQAKWNWFWSWKWLHIKIRSLNHATILYICFM